ncbi:hemolymph juvenile hormone binding [Trinorchestia longiramus]|nr:hemolymph juvenile hormone binding [Trinorchestia longiramus]
MRYLNIGAFVALQLLLLSGRTDSSSCREGEAADRVLLHFRHDHPRGVPGFDLPPWVPLITPLAVGPITLVDTHAWGLDELELHSLLIQAHSLDGMLNLSIPRLVVAGVYEIPGLWWTTTGNFSLTLTNVTATTTLNLTVLADSCFYLHDYQANITRGNFSYNTDGLLDDSGMLDIFFDELFDLLVNLTKPTLLDFANTYIRYSLTNFLPPDNFTSLTTSVPRAPSEDNSSPTEIPSPTPILPHDAFAPVILPWREQMAALLRFVSYQIHWMIGDPMSLPDFTLNIIGIAELHNMSVHNLALVTRLEHLALEYDGENFTITTQMLHDQVYNRHRVLWFPGAIFRTWQWTEASLGLVKHRAVMQVHRKLQSPPRLVEFSARPVVFNPNHTSSGVRTMSRWARRLMDGVRTSFGDSIKAFFYSPIVHRVQRIMNSMDTRSLIKQFVCFAAGHTE